MKTNQAIVIKVGTNVLVRPDGQLNNDVIERIAYQAQQLRWQDLQVILVSSGAVLCGNGKPLPVNATLVQKRIRAAVGQPRLMYAWQCAFGPFSTRVGQVLGDYQQFEHAEMTEVLAGMLEDGIVPIVNYNDVASPTEMVADNKGGDNDTLSAIVARVMGAQTLILLTKQDGLMRSVGCKLERVAGVARVTDDILALAKLVPTDRSSGMQYKLEAAKSATEHGITVFIGNGLTPGIIHALLDGEDVGTRFVAQTKLK